MTNEFFADFSNSFKFDRRIFAADIRVSIAYCDELFSAGIFTRLESERVRNALQSILKRGDYDRNYFTELIAEDVHSFIEARLVQLIGETGRKLATGRNRVDQAATAFRLWLREEIEEISNLARELQKALIASAENQKDAVLPGYTNLRRTQPILWAHWCLAYFEMFARDRERLDETWRRVNVLPLGAGNPAGTSFEIDRESLARNLYFEGVAANSLDAVSDCDFCIEFIGACALLIMHLSRLAEDLILYDSTEFGFVELENKTFSDSNKLPPTRKTAALQLIRGKAGRIFGHQTALLSMMKNLPLAYNDDMQESKEAVFDAADTIKNCLQAAKIVFESARINTENTRRAATHGYLNSNELADYLTLRNVPPAVVKKNVEEIVSFAISKNKEINELSLEELRKFSEIFEKDVFEHLTLEKTLASKNQIGGTAPERVFEAIEQARENLAREEN